MYLRLTSAAEGKAMTSDEAQGMIAAASGEKFQSGVVDAFAKVFSATGRAASAGA